MAIAPTLQKYLTRTSPTTWSRNQPTLSSMRAAEACHISGDGLAKAVVLRRDGGYMLAVLPASHHIRLADLKRQIGMDLDLA
jgi:Ala-tRNA(Pro) deacylase